MKSAPLLLCLLVLMSFGAAAQSSQSRSASVYRCGPEGRDLRDSPCPNDPKASAASVTFDQPDAAAQRAARARASEDARDASRMERQRLKREAQENRSAARPARIDGLAAPAPAQAASAPVKSGKRTPPKPAKAASR